MYFLWVLVGWWVSVILYALRAFFLSRSHGGSKNYVYLTSVYQAKGWCLQQQQRKKVD
jgi:hypothetical protein